MCTHRWTWKFSLLIRLYTHKNKCFQRRDDLWSVTTNFKKPDESTITNLGALSYRSNSKNCKWILRTVNQVNGETINQKKYITQNTIWKNYWAHNEYEDRIFTVTVTVIIETFPIIALFSDLGTHKIYSKYCK